MNKKLLAAWALIAMLSLASCGQSEEVVTPELDDTNVDFNIEGNVEMEEVTPIIEMEEVTPVVEVEEFFIDEMSMEAEVIAE